MAATTRLLWDNETLDSAVTITSSSEVTNRPDDNVANRGRWKVWRSSTTTGDQWIKFDLGSAKTLKSIFLVNYTAHTGGSIKVQAHSSDAWGTPDVDETLTLPSFNPTEVVGAFFSSVSRQWVRVFFSNDASANEYVDLGVCFAGDYLQPSSSIFEQFGVRRIDPSKVVRALDGQEESQSRTKFYQFNGEFLFRPDAEKDSFAQAFETIGVSIPFFFVLDITDPDLQFYGHFEQALNLSHSDMADGSNWNIPFSFMESR
jgi:hypothetical protein